MATEWEKIETAFKKLQPAIKKLDGFDAEKAVKLAKSALKTAWDDEEKFIEAFKAAKKAGVEGKKPADFLGDAGFKKTYAALSKSAGLHHDATKALNAGAKQSKILETPLRKMVMDIKKIITKGNKEQAKFQTEVQKAADKAKIVPHAMGKLTAPELFYGAQFTKVVDKIINKSKNAGGPSGDAKKLTEPKEMAKNVKTVVTLAKQVAKLCQAAKKKGEVDAKAGVPYLKKAATLIQRLKAFDAAYSKLKKKEAKLIKESKDKSKIVKAIATVAKAQEVSAKSYAEALALIKEKAA